MKIIPGLFAAGLIAVAVEMTLTMSTVSAHHSFSAFTMTTEKTITGTVKKVDWTNPHTWIWVDVTNNQGSVETFGFAAQRQPAGVVGVEPVDIFMWRDLLQRLVWIEATSVPPPANR